MHVGSKGEKTCKYNCPVFQGHSAANTQSQSVKTKSERQNIRNGKEERKDRLVQYEQEKEKCNESRNVTRFYTTVDCWINCIISGNKA